MGLNVNDRGLGVLQVAQLLTKKKGLTGPFAVIRQIRNAQRLIKGEIVDGMTLKDLEQYKGAFVKSHSFAISRLSSSEYSKIESSIRKAKELKRDNNIMYPNLKAYENGLTEISGRHMENFKQLQDAVNRWKGQGIDDQLDELVAKYGEKLDELDQKIGSSQEQINERRQLIERNGAQVIEEVLRGSSNISDSQKAELGDALKQNDVHSVYASTRALDRSIMSEYEALMGKLSGPIDDLKSFLAPDDVSEALDQAKSPELEKTEVVHAEPQLGGADKTVKRSKTTSPKKKHKAQKQRSSFQITNSSSNQAIDALKKQAATTQKNMQKKLKSHTNYQLLNASAAFPDTCLSLLMDDNQPGSGTMLDTLASLMEERKITRDVYNDCAAVINDGFMQLASLSPLNLQERFPKIFEEKQKISDELDRLGECSRNGRGDVGGQENIDKSLERIDSLCEDGEFRKQLQEAAQPYLECMNGVLDKLLSLVGDENKGVIDGIRAKVQVSDRDVSELVGNNGAQEPILPETTTPTESAARDIGQVSSKEEATASPMSIVSAEEFEKFQANLEDTKQKISDYSDRIGKIAGSYQKMSLEIEHLVDFVDGPREFALLPEDQIDALRAQAEAILSSIRMVETETSATYDALMPISGALNTYNAETLAGTQNFLTENIETVNQGMSRLPTMVENLEKRNAKLQENIAQFMRDYNTALESVKQGRLSSPDVQVTKSLDKIVNEFRDKLSESDNEVMVNILSAISNQVSALEEGGSISKKLENLLSDKSIGSKTYKQCMTKLKEGSKQLEELQNVETELGMRISDAAQLPTKITAGIQKLEAGEGDANCEKEIRDSLIKLGDCFLIESNYGSFEVAQENSSRITRDTLDGIRKLVGEQNQGVFDEIRKELGLVGS